MTQRTKLARRMDIFSYFITAFILLMIFFMRKIHIDTDIDFGFLPPVYSALNAITALFLIYAFIQIKNKRIEKLEKLLNKE